MFYNKLLVNTKEEEKRNESFEIYFKVVCYYGSIFNFFSRKTVGRFCNFYLKGIFVILVNGIQNFNTNLNLNLMDFFFIYLQVSLLTSFKENLKNVKVSI